jgi:O-antigen ligase
MLLSLVQNPWVGTGFESFWLGPRLQTIWKLYWWHPNEAHNGYLEVFLNIGWVGLALLVVFLASTYWKLFIAWRNNTLIGGLGLAYFFAGIVFNFTEAAFFRMQAPVWIFFVLAAVGAPTISYGRAIASSQDSESASWPER